MAKEQVSAIEFTSEFDMMATIKKVETFDSKGGGLLIKLETSEVEKVRDILAAKGNVLQITVKVSTQKSIAKNDDAGQLPLGQAVGDGED